MHRRLDKDSNRQFTAIRVGINKPSLMTNCSANASLLIQLLMDCFPSSKMGGFLPPLLCERVCHCQPYFYSIDRKERGFTFRGSKVERLEFARALCLWRAFTFGYGMESRAERKSLRKCAHMKTATIISLIMDAAAIAAAIHAIRLARRAIEMVSSSRASRLAESASTRAKSLSANQAETKANGARPG